VIKTPNAPRPRAVFFGTPEFAVTVLQALLSPDSPVEVALVVTQPDRPVGRSLKLQAAPVKEIAADHGVPVRQPLSLRRPTMISSITEVGAEVGIVVAYGRILPTELLNAFPHGCLNVHGSILPRWRGAWPIGAAIQAGDTETGVTIMRLDAGMDTGPVLATRARPLSSEATTASLSPVLASDGAALLCEVLPTYLGGEIKPVPQDDARATWCRLVAKADGVIDWSRPAAELDRHVRAMDDWPGAWTTWAGRRLVVRAATVAPAGDYGQPGQVRVMGATVTVATGAGALALRTIQVEGRGPVEAAAFARGQRSFNGSVLGQ
jgi:methionyl-tRNA formyltransferase